MSTGLDRIAEINGRTELYAVFGHPVAHSLSPPMQNAGLHALGRDAVYVAFDVAPEALMEVLHGCRQMGFKGINLTVPLKQVAFAGLTELDASAQRARAVNTVEFTTQGLRGHNTDAYGFLTDCEACFGASVSGRSVAILGTGGAARGAALACADAGAGAVTVFGRRPEAVAELSSELESESESCEIRGVGLDEPSWEAQCREADLVVQCTSVGMHAGEGFFASAAAFRPKQWAYDLIYTSQETPFMQVAKEGGASTSNGLGMLLHQGARSLSIWTGQDAPVDAMREALSAAVYGA